MAGGCACTDPERHTETHTHTLAQLETIKYRFSCKKFLVLCVGTFTLRLQNLPITINGHKDAYSRFLNLSDSYSFLP